MEIARLLVLQERSDGVFVDRFDELGGVAGDTWHESINDAKLQAAVEYGDNLGEWIRVPDDEKDPVSFGFRVISQGSR